MFDTDPPHLYALAPGVDFPAALVDGLMQRMAGRPPEAMARVTVFVNTTRMRRRIVELMSANGAQFLPRIGLVTDLGPGPHLIGLAQPVPKLRRLLQLSVLISGLLDRVPDLAPRSAIADLSASLTALMAEMEGEGVTPDRVANLDVSDFSEHWARTRAFLTIIAPFFTDATAPSAEGRQRAIVQRLASLWDKAPPSDPVIVAGSTGSRGMTALFMQAVCRLPQGAVILPGFDFDMPAAVWGALSDPLSAQDHPQYRLGKLIRDVGMAPGDVRPWIDTPPPSEARNRVLSLALRPAPVTDQWITEGPKLVDLAASLADVSLIEAASPRHEALSIALVLRDAAGRGQTAALVSPDRTLTRQVSAALGRWGIRADDSAGVPLNQSAPGRLLRHVVRLFGVRPSSDALLVVLKHPLTASAMERGVHLLLTRDLELKLRREGPAFPTGADLVAWAGAHPNPLALGWATALAGVIDGLEAQSSAPLADHVARTVTLAERLARGPAPEGSGELWLEAAGEEALSFMQGLAREAEHGGTLHPSEFRDLFDGLISAEMVRDPTIAHPGISIWGTMEARVQGADLVVLGGLNDGVWPGLPPPDPWLNRKMRQDAGLLAPEREIGLSAHDFQQAIAARTVILSRALRNADAETVPSRWVNRLCNLLDGLPEQGGRQALADMRARGRVWLGLAGAMDRPLADPSADLRPAPRPAPSPPIGKRPKELSLTRIETLIRDPYAIYADKVLRLRPLSPTRPVADARDRGTVVHGVLERFVRERPEDETRDMARARLLQIAAEVLAGEVPWPAARALWAARIERAANHFLTIDARGGGKAILIEERGELRLHDLDFTVFGTPDRIDLLPDGTLHLIDYKTGSAPTPDQIKSFSKQLHLAALMAQEGGFRRLGPQTVSAITYVGLGGKGGETSVAMTEEVIESVRKGLRVLVSAYASADKGYASRRAVMTEMFPGDYDHLARFGEWEMTDSPLVMPVGQGDADDT